MWCCPSEQSGSAHFQMRIHFPSGFEPKLRDLNPGRVRHRPPCPQRTEKPKSLESPIWSDCLFLCLLPLERLGQSVHPYSWARSSTGWLTEVCASRRMKTRRCNVGRVLGAIVDSLLHVVILSRSVSHPATAAEGRAGPRIGGPSLLCGRNGLTEAKTGLIRSWKQRQLGAISTFRYDVWWC